MGKIDRDLTNEEVEKFKSETVVKKDKDCLRQVSDFSKNIELNPSGYT